jgi:Putative zinc-finger
MIDDLQLPQGDLRLLNTTGGSTGSSREPQNFGPCPGVPGMPAGQPDPHRHHGRHRAAPRPRRPRGTARRGHRRGSRRRARARERNGVAVNDLRCAEFVEHVTSLLDGALDDTTEHDLREHLPACPGCQRYLDQMQQTIRALGGLPVVPASACRMTTARLVVIRSESVRRAGLARGRHRPAAGGTYT